MRLEATPLFPHAGQVAAPPPGSIAAHPAATPCALTASWLRRRASRCAAPPRGSRAPRRTAGGRRGSRSRGGRTRSRPAFAHLRQVGKQQLNCRSSGSADAKQEGRDSAPMGRRCDCRARRRTRGPSAGPRRRCSSSGRRGRRRRGSAPTRCSATLRTELPRQAVVAEVEAAAAAASAKERTHLPCASYNPSLAQKRSRSRAATRRARASVDTARRPAACRVASRSAGVVQTMRPRVPGARPQRPSASRSACRRGA